MFVLVLNRYTANEGFVRENFYLLLTEKINELFEWSATGSFSKKSFLPLFVYWCESGLNPPIIFPCIVSHNITKFYVLPQISKNYFNEKLC